MDWDDALVLDESRPRSCRIPPGTTQVEFGNSLERPVDRDKLLDVLMRQDNRLGVKALRIKYSSEMLSPWVVAAFPALGDVNLVGKKIRALDDLTCLEHLTSLGIDLHSKRRSLAVLPGLGLDRLGVATVRKDEEHLGQCTTLSSLSAVTWQWPDLVPIAPLRLKYFWMRGGGAQALGGLNCEKMDMVAVLACRKLTTVAGIETRELRVIGCNDLDLESVSEVGRLKLLLIIEQRELADLSFLRGCGELHELAVTATRITARDFSPIIESPTLRKVWLCPNVKKADVKTIAEANPKLAVCNGSVCYVHGEQCDESEYHRV